MKKYSASVRGSPTPGLNWYTRTTNCRFVSDTRDVAYFTKGPDYQNNAVDTAGLYEQGKYLEDPSLGPRHAQVFLQATLQEAMGVRSHESWSVGIKKMTHKVLTAIKEVAARFVARDNAAATEPPKPLAPHIKRTSVKEILVDCEAPIRPKTRTTQSKFLVGTCRGGTY